MKNFKLKFQTLIVLLIFSLNLHSQDNDIGKRMAWYKYGIQKKYKSKELKKLPNDLILTINQKDTAEIEIPNFVNFNASNNGEKSFTGFLINNTKSIKNIFTQDNSLLMIMEAKDSTEKWNPIEFWMWSDCGNSYFNPLNLEKGKFVTFKIPIYNGEIRTKMRLKLIGQDKFIYSDEFNGQLTKKQLYEIIERDKEYFWDNDIYLEKHRKSEK